MTKLTQTPKQKVDELKTFLKTTRRPDERDRARAVLKLIEGQKRQTVANFFDIHIKTLDEWQRAFKRQGLNGLRTQSPLGNNHKLSREQKEAIKAVINSKGPNNFGLEGKFWTVPALRQYVKKEYNIIYKSTDSYRRLFDFCGFSFHKPDKVNKKQNPHMRKRFEEVLKKSSNGTCEKLVWYW